MSKRLTTILRRSGCPDVTYDGISGVLRKQFDNIEQRMVVIAWFDGEPDLWLVEDAAGLKELRRYYTDEWGPERPIPFTILKKSEIQE